MATLLLQAFLSVVHYVNMADDDKKNPENLSREETLAMISHELRTSLTASKWMLEMLETGDVGELTIPQKETVAKLISSNSRMMDVATNLIMLAKTSSHESEYHMGMLDIVDIIDSVVFELGSAAFEQHIEIVYVKPDGQFPNVRADESKMRIVFQNLIDNAIKYSKSGDRIVISLDKNDQTATISIKDTGIGIAEKDLPMITTQFYRASNAAEKAKAGSGIGLYICKRIVEAHGGKLSIASELGKGTTVHVILPIANGESPVV